MPCVMEGEQDYWKNTGIHSRYDEVERWFHHYMEKEAPFLGVYRRNTESESIIVRFKRNLPSFDGFWHTEDFLRWIDDIEDFFAEVRPPRDLKCKIVWYKMEGTAYYWWKQLQEDRKRQDKQEIISWSKMKTLLISVFAPSRCSKKGLAEVHGSNNLEENNVCEMDVDLCRIAEVDEYSEILGASMNLTTKIGVDVLEKPSSGKTAIDEKDNGGGSREVESSMSRLDKFMPTRCLKEVLNQDVSLSLIADETDHNPELLDELKNNDNKEQLNEAEQVNIQNVGPQASSLSFDIKHVSKSVGRQQGNGFQLLEVLDGYKGDSQAGGTCKWSKNDRHQQLEHQGCLDLQQSKVKEIMVKEVLGAAQDICKEHIGELQKGMYQLSLLGIIAVDDCGQIIGAMLCICQVLIPNLFLSHGIISAGMLSFIFDPGGKRRSHTYRLNTQSMDRDHFHIYNCLRAHLELKPPVLVVSTFYIGMVLQVLPSRKHDDNLSQETIQFLEYVDFRYYVHRSVSCLFDPGGECHLEKSRRTISRIGMLTELSEVRTLRGNKNLNCMVLNEVLEVPIANLRVQMKQEFGNAFQGAEFLIYCVMTTLESNISHVTVDMKPSIGEGMSGVVIIMEQDQWDMLGTKMERCALKLIFKHTYCSCVAIPINRSFTTGVDTYLTPFLKRYLYSFLENRHDGLVCFRLVNLLKSRARSGVRILNGYSFSCSVETRTTRLYSSLWYTCRVRVWLTKIVGRIFLRSLDEFAANMKRLNMVVLLPLSYTSGSNRLCIPDLKVYIAVDIWLQHEVSTALFEMMREYTKLMTKQSRIFKIWPYTLHLLFVGSITQAAPILSLVVLGGSYNRGYEMTGVRKDLYHITMTLLNHRWYVSAINHISVKIDTSCMPIAANKHSTSNGFTSAKFDKNVMEIGFCDGGHHVVKVLVFNFDLGGSQYLPIHLLHHKSVLKLKSCSLKKNKKQPGSQAHCYLHTSLGRLRKDKARESAHAFLSYDTGGVTDHSILDNERLIIIPLTELKLTKKNMQSS